MEQAKKIWQSKTVWGIVIALLATLLKQFLGVEIPELPVNADAAQLEAYYAAVKAAKGDVSSIIATVVQAAGFLWALYGRITAEKKIS